MLTDHVVSGSMAITDVDRAVHLAQHAAATVAANDLSAMHLDATRMQDMRAAVLEQLVGQAAEQAAAGNSSKVAAAVECLAKHAACQAACMHVRTLCTVLVEMSHEQWPRAVPALQHVAMGVQQQLKDLPVNGKLPADVGLLDAAAAVCSKLGIKDAAMTIRSG
jgi:hypothetical protein